MVQTVSEAFLVLSTVKVKDLHPKNDTLQMNIFKMYLKVNDVSELNQMMTPQRSKLSPEYPLTLELLLLITKFIS